MYTYRYIHTYTYTSYIIYRKNRVADVADHRFPSLIQQAIGNVCVYVYVLMCVYIYLYIYTYIYIRMYIYAYVNIYTYQ
jgi:hypothetical protein